MGAGGQAQPGGQADLHHLASLDQGQSPPRIGVVGTGDIAPRRKGGVDDAMRYSVTHGKTAIAAAIRMPEKPVAQQSNRALPPIPGAQISTFFAQSNK